MRFALFFIVLLMSCQKKEEEPISYSGNIKGRVYHKYTGEGLANIPLLVESGNKSASGNLYKLVSDKSGDVEVVNGGPNADYHIEPQLTVEFDSTANVWRFMPVSFRFGSNSPRPLYMPLVPSGWLRAVIKNSDWSQVPADSVEVITSYEKQILKPGVSVADFYLEPSQKHAIKLRLYNEGYSGDTISKSVYVPNYYHDKTNWSVFIYTLPF